MTATSTDTGKRRGPAPALPATDLSQSARPSSDVRAISSTLLDEARSLGAKRRWKAALATLDSHVRLHGESPETFRLAAVAATNARRRRRADAAIEALRAEAEPTAPSLAALAEVALARRDFEVADLLARRAVETDPLCAEAWGTLAAGYAGLGWFLEASECLDRADALGGAEHANWLVGRATNHWSLERTWATAITAVLAFFFGLLAIAVGLTVPFVVREARLTRLDDRFASLAARAWTEEVRLRIGHAAAVVTVVVGWVALVQFG